jgi:para-nitrobenzyl esterase
MPSKLRDERERKIAHATDGSAMTTTVERSTRLGLVLGVVRLGVETYRGLRYAQPVERYQPAVLFRSGWRGTYDAITYKAMAPQTPVLPEVYGPVPDAPFSEDCLFLNIHVPQMPSMTARPVIVFIHGGSFVSGAANFYDGTALACGADAVVVCINYRLGVFAAFDLTWLGTQHDGGGQHWLGDQITALQWVRDNIADYGGDPNLVTIIGESAGAVSVGALCLAPKADGLVHRAVACSPGYLITDPSIDVVGAIASLRRRSRDEAVEYLRQAPAEELIAIQKRGAAIVPTPVSNTPLLPGSPEDLIRARGPKAVPFIAGYATHEGLLLDIVLTKKAGYPPPLSTVLCHLVARMIAQHAAKGRANVPAYLRRLKKATASIGFGGRFNDLVWTDGFRRAATEYCEETSRAGSRGHLYIVDIPMRIFGRRIGSSHGIDLPLTFNIWDDPEHTVPEFTDHPAASALARRWVQMLGHFARHGEPGDALGEWAAYESGQRSSLRVSCEGCRVEHDTDGLFRRQVWN